MKNLCKRKALLLVILMVVVIFPSCRKKTDRELFLEMMSDIGKFVEDKDINKIMPLISEDYSDFQNRGKMETMDMLRSYFRQFRGIVFNVLSSHIDELSPEEASIQTDVSLSSGGVKILRKLVRVSPDNYRITMKLRKRNGQWYIRYAEWEYISLEELFPESLAILKKILKTD